MTQTPELQPVEQSDREAAADLVRWQRTATSEWKQDGGEAWQFFAAGFPRGILQGIWDEHHIVQAFARHRLSHAIHEPASVMREEAVKVGNDALCRLIEDMCPERNDLGYPIGPQVEALAAAIRNLPLSDGVG